MAVPSEITGLGHTFTTSSLDFTWDAQSEADGYVATLYRDGAQVASQDVATAAASFTGLEDGTTYTLELYAYNAEGDGPTTSYQATTGYVIPATPTNLRQFEERIIAVICRWDLSEPDKIHDVQVQLLYGSELLFDEVNEGAPTERTFVVPMASTDYLLRVRAGNPAGWSAWAEATVHSEKFPLIDSRLGVMGATYQEDALYPDTWDGGTDLAGVGDPQPVEGGVELVFGQAALVDTSDTDDVSTNVAISNIASRVVKKDYSSRDISSSNTSVSITDIESRLVKINYSLSEKSSASSSVSISDIVSVVKQYRYTDPDEAVSAGTSVSVSDIVSSVP